MTGGMMFKGTKSEWLIDEIEEDEKYEIYPALDGPPNIGRWAEICVVKDYHGSAKENACLIAAAPELLEALTDCVGRFTEAFPAAENYDPIIKARAAIAKALGEQK